MVHGLARAIVVAELWRVCDHAILQALSGSALTAQTNDAYYEANADRLLIDYERVSFEEIHQDLLQHVLAQAGNALDVGCGSGRDAAWLARNGWNVVAVDPSLRMLKGAARLHAEPNIVWKQDRLPALNNTRVLNRSYELILLTAVLMHLPPQEQRQSIETVMDLCAPLATVALSVRGSRAEGRLFFDVDTDKVSTQFAKRGFTSPSVTQNRDHLGRPNVVWKRLVFRRTAAD